MTYAGSEEAVDAVLLQPNLVIGLLDLVDLEEDAMSSAVNCVSALAEWDAGRNAILANDTSSLISGLIDIIEDKEGEVEDQIAAAGCLEHIAYQSMALDFTL